jgi:RecB family exonuclease
LDRVDAPADGGVAIIDYKTGAAKPPARWFDARPQAPQLGLYALAERAFAPALPVRALVYAQLKPGELRIHGIAADPRAWPGLPAPAQIAGAELADWQATEARLMESLAALAVEVREGHAPVDPRDTATTCRSCGLQSLCRIGAPPIDVRAENGDE